MRPAPNAYYGENVATVRAALDAYAPLLGDDPLALEAILARLERTLGRNAARPRGHRHGAARSGRPADRPALVALVGDWSATPAR